VLRAYYNVYNILHLYCCALSREWQCDASNSSWKYLELPSIREQRHLSFMSAHIAIWHLVAWEPLVKRFLAADAVKFLVRSTQITPIVSPLLPKRYPCPCVTINVLFI